MLCADVCSWQLLVGGMVAGTAPMVDVPGMPPAQQTARREQMKKYIGLEGMPSCDASIGDMQKFERKRSMRYKVHMYPITELECMTVSQRHSSPAAHTVVLTPGRSTCPQKTADFGNKESASLRPISAWQCDLHSARIAAQW